MYTLKYHKNGKTVLYMEILKTKLGVTTPHKHPPEPSQVEVTKVIAKIKLNAAHSSVNQSQINVQFLLQ